MNNEDGEDSKDSQKGGFSLVTIALWAAAVIILYVLASGPVVMLADKYLLSGTARRLAGTVYSPLSWTYEKTPLHKPIGMYLHLWDTNYDSSGDRR